jgi:hypothetical protein
MRNVEISKLLGERWQQMSPEEKAPFEEAARADYERYRSEIRQWKEITAPECMPVKDPGGAEAIFAFLRAHDDIKVLTGSAREAHQRTDHDRNELTG